MQRKGYFNPLPASGDIWERLREFKEYVPLRDGGFLGPRPTILIKISGIPAAGK